MRSPSEKEIIDLLQGAMNVAALVVFWAFFAIFFAGVSFVAWRSVASHAPMALVVQGVWLLWCAAIVFTLLQRQVAHGLTAVAVLSLWLPLCFQVFRRLYFWATVGMELPDGTGSPMAFIFGFVLEWAFFLPLCGMLGILLVTRPWRRHA